MQYFIWHLTPAKSPTRASATGRQRWGRGRGGAGAVRPSATGWRRCAFLVVSSSLTNPCDTRCVLARKLPFESPPLTARRGDLSSFTVRLGCDPGPEFRLNSLDGQGWLARISAPLPRPPEEESATLTTKYKTAWRIQNETAEERQLRYILVPLMTRFSCFWTRGPVILFCIIAGPGLFSPGGAVVFLKFTAGGDNIDRFSPAHFPASLWIYGFFLEHSCHDLTDS